MAAGQEWTFQRLGKLFTVPQQPHHSYTSDLADESLPQWALSPQVGVQKILPFQGHRWTGTCQLSTHESSCYGQTQGLAGKCSTAHVRELQGGTAIPFWKTCLVYVSRTISFLKAQSFLLLVGKRPQLPISYHETYAQKDRYPDLKAIRKENTVGKEALPSSVGLGKGSGTHGPSSRS